MGGFFGGFPPSPSFSSPDIGTATGTSLQFTDTTLIRDAANVLALRNGTNAQAFKLYGTFTNSTNYGRFGFFALSNKSFKFATETAGTGAANDTTVHINSNGSSGDIRLTLTGSESIGKFLTASSGQPIDSLMGANGSEYKLRIVSTTVNASNGAGTISASNIIPAGAQVFGVTSRVTTGFGTSGGLTSISIGDGTTADLWSATTGITATTTTKSTNYKSTWVHGKFYPSATSVVITANGGNFDATGVIRISVCYYDDVAPTS